MAPAFSPCSPAQVETKCSRREREEEILDENEKDSQRKPKKKKPTFVQEELGRA